MRNLAETSFAEILGGRDKPLHFLHLNDFLSKKLPQKEFIVEPIFPRQGLMMIYARRGIGKTYFALYIACAIAGGFNILGDRWKVDKARKVLYIDGEMPAGVMQERLKIFSDSETIPDHKNLIITTPDIQDYGIMPNLAKEEDQQKIESIISEQSVEVVVIDNLSTLCRVGKENEADSWIPMQEWILKLRSCGISVILIHHAGKNDDQRGTSKKEDILDTVIRLKRPKDYEAKQGARFAVSFEKSRGFMGDSANDFEVTMEIIENKILWKSIEIEDLEEKMVAELHAAKMSQREIAKELGISLSKVHRLKKRRDDSK